MLAVGIHIGLRDRIGIEPFVSSSDSALKMPPSITKCAT